MKRALISDLHSNIEALDSVLADIRAEGIDEVLCLGDLVGYGPNPREVIDRVMDCKVCLLGNHDQGALFDPEGFNSGAERAIFWTRNQLENLIRAFLTAGVMENGLVGPVDEGTPQGGPLSPLLSNLVLDELDRELERRKHCFVRYADDCNIYVRSRRAGERVKLSITGFIMRRLKLKVNEAKSAVARPLERKFLGFSFTGAREPKRRIAAKALVRFKQKVRALTGRTRGTSIEQGMKELAGYLRGWKGYFGFCETPSALERLDQWIRHRLRSMIWKQWKRGRVRFARLCHGE